MLLIETYTAKSDIEGYGLFTRSPIIKGFPIWKIGSNDMIIPYNEWIDLQHGNLDEYILKYGTINPDKSLFLDGDECKYMNHSTDPNVMFTQNFGFTTRKINSGEELTCNYYSVTQIWHAKKLLNES